MENYGPIHSRFPRILVKFDGLNYFPSELLMGGLELVEHVLHKFEEEAVEKFLIQNELDSAIYAVRAEMDKMRRRHLQILDANSGSIELFGVIGGLSIWVLQLTVGESMKDAYKKSGMHAVLSELFSSDVTELSDKLSKSLKHELRTARRNSAFVVALSRVNVDVLVQSNRRYSEHVVIRFQASSSYESIPENIFRP